VSFLLDRHQKIEDLIVEALAWRENLKPGHDALCVGVSEGVRRIFRGTGERELGEKGRRNSG